MENFYEDLLMIDHLNESIDWFNLVYGETKLEIARRVKASPTKTLEFLTKETGNNPKGAQKFQRDFARRELLLRKTNGDIHINGDPRFKSKVNGYDKIDKDAIAEEIIAEFVSSDDENLKDKTREERIELALQKNYNTVDLEESISDKRAIKILELSTKSKNRNLLKFFYESDKSIISKSTLVIRDSYEKFLFELTEATIAIGAKGKVKCIQRFGACRVGDVYDGVWKQAARPEQLKLELTNLPGATSHPTIFFDKNTKQVNIQKQFELL